MIKEAIEQEILAFAETSPQNRMSETSRYFDTPLVGFAAGDDPLWQTYKEQIGPFHRSPGEWIEAAFGDGFAKSCSVISWILPITEETRVSQSRKEDVPSLEWAQTRSFGEDFNDSLRRHMVEFLSAKGYKVLAPFLDDQWKTLRDERGPTSNWSERHVAHAAGLGTFSLNDALITARGIAHRCGSVVVDTQIATTPRPYSSHTEYCLYCREGKCGACIARCPVDAISCRNWPGNTGSRSPVADSARSRCPVRAGSLNRKSRFWEEELR